MTAADWKYGGNSASGHSSFGKNCRTGLQQAAGARTKLQIPAGQPADSIDEDGWTEGFSEACFSSGSASVGAALCPEAGRCTDELLAALDRLAVQQFASPNLAADRAGPRLRIKHPVRNRGLELHRSLRRFRLRRRAAHRTPFLPPPDSDVFKTGLVIHSALQLVIYFTLYTFLCGNVPVRNINASGPIQSARSSLCHPIRPWVAFESRSTRRAASVCGTLKSNSTWLPWRTATSAAPATTSSRRTRPSSA